MLFPPYTVMNLLFLEDTSTGNEPVQGSMLGGKSTLASRKKRSEGSFFRCSVDTSAHWASVFLRSECVESQDTNTSCGGLPWDALGCILITHPASMHTLCTPNKKASGPKPVKP